MARIGLFLTVALLLVACGGSAAERTSAKTTANVARLVYVKGSSIYVARADATKPKRLAKGSSPAISPNGRVIGYVSADREELRMLPPSGGEFLQTTIDDRNLYDVNFSPDSKFVGVTSPSRLYINNVNTGETIKTGRARIAGWSFSPDSKKVIYAKAAAGSDYGGPSDLYVLDLTTKRSTRMTTDRAAANPLWTSLGIVYDQITAGSVLPRLNLQRRDDQGGDVANVVDSGPTPDALTSGLVPVAASSNGQRILASFEGQSRNDPYAVENLTARDLSGGHAFVPTDLSRDGSTVLAFTGVGDPSDPTDVVTIPWGGGAPKVLVRNATQARWNR